MRKPKNFWSGGVTLIELLISLGIASALALVIAALSVKFTELQKVAEQEANQLEDVALFTNALHQAIDPAVQVLCNCGRVTGGTINTACTFDPSVVPGNENRDACAYSRNSTDYPQNCYSGGGVPEFIVLAGFVTETSDDLLAEGAAPQCYRPVVWNSVMPVRPLRGCKKIYQLRYRPPRPRNVGVLASQPGLMEIVDITQTVMTNGSLATGLGQIPLNPSLTGNVVAQLKNVSYARCGLTRDMKFNNAAMTERRANNATMTGFRMQVKLKQTSRMPREDETSASFGDTTFYPLDSDYGKMPAFFYEFEEAFSFKNLIYRGISFSQTKSEACIKDGQPTTRWSQCCSLNLDRNNDAICANSNESCINAGDTATVAGQCCSKMILGSGRCL